MARKRWSRQCPAWPTDVNALFKWKNEQAKKGAAHPRRGGENAAVQAIKTRIQQGRGYLGRHHNGSGEPKNEIQLEFEPIEPEKPHSRQSDRPYRRVHFAGDAQQDQNVPSARSSNSSNQQPQASPTIARWQTMYGPVRPPTPPKNSMSERNWPMDIHITPSKEDFQVTSRSMKGTRSMPNLGAMVLSEPVYASPVVPRQLDMPSHQAKELPSTPFSPMPVQPILAVTLDAMRQNDNVSVFDIGNARPLSGLPALPDFSHANRRSPGVPGHRRHVSDHISDTLQEHSHAPRSSLEQTTPPPYTPSEDMDHTSEHREDSTRYENDSTRNSPHMRPQLQHRATMPELSSFVNDMAQFHEPDTSICVDHEVTYDQVQPQSQPQTVQSRDSVPHLWRPSKPAVDMADPMGLHPAFRANPSPFVLFCQPSPAVTPQFQRQTAAVESDIRAVEARSAAALSSSGVKRSDSRMSIISRFGRGKRRPISLQVGDDSHLQVMSRDPLDLASPASSAISVRTEIFLDSFPNPPPKDLSGNETSENPVMQWRRSSRHIEQSLHRVSVISTARSPSLLLPATTYVPEEPAAKRKEKQTEKKKSVDHKHGKRKTDSKKRTSPPPPKRWTPPPLPPPVGPLPVLPLQINKPAEHVRRDSLVPARKAEETPKIEITSGAAIKELVAWAETFTLPQASLAGQLPAPSPLDTPTHAARNVIDLTPNIFLELDSTPIDHISRPFSGPRSRTAPPQSNNGHLSEPILKQMPLPDSAAASQASSQVTSPLQAISDASSEADASGNPSNIYKRPIHSGPFSGPYNGRSSFILSQYHFSKQERERVRAFKFDVKSKNLRSQYRDSSPTRGKRMSDKLRQQQQQREEVEVIDFAAWPPQLPVTQKPLPKTPDAGVDESVVVPRTTEGQHEQVQPSMVKASAMAAKPPVSYANGASHGLWRKSSAASRRGGDRAPLPSSPPLPGLLWPAASRKTSTRRQRGSVVPQLGRADSWVRKYRSQLYAASLNSRAGSVAGSRAGSVYGDYD